MTAAPTALVLLLLLPLLHAANSGTDATAPAVTPRKPRRDKLLFGLAFRPFHLLWVAPNAGVRLVNSVGRYIAADTDYNV